MQSKSAPSSNCQARLTTVNGIIRCPGTRVLGEHGCDALKSRVIGWRVRIRPAELSGQPLVPGTYRMAPLDRTQPDQRRQQAFVGSPMPRATQLLFGGHKVCGCLQGMY